MSNHWRIDNNVLYYQDEAFYELDIDNPLVDEGTINLVVSADEKYAAITNIETNYVDVFKASGSNDYPEYIYSMKRSSYYPSKTSFVFHFIQHPVEDKQLFIFNKNHGELGVYDAETAKELHTDHAEDKFIIQMKVVDNEFLLLYGWYWTPVYFIYIYDIKHFLTRPNYEAVTLDTYEALNKHDEGEFYINSNNQIEAFHEGHPYHKIYELREYYDNHENITTEKNNYIITNMIVSNSSNLLHRLSEVDTDQNKNIVFEGDAREKLTDMLRCNDEVIECHCVGNNSKKLLPNHVYSVAKACKYTDDKFNYLVPRILFHGFISKLTNLTEINLTFTLEKNDVGTLEIIMNQKMRLSQGTENLYEVDPDEECFITIRSV